MDWRKRTVASKQAAGKNIEAAVEGMSTTSSGHDGRVYETDKAVEEYLLFHFGADKDLLPYDASIAPVQALHFAQRTARMALDALQARLESSVAAGRPRPTILRALDVGCAVGGSSFELSSGCDGVIGLDFSHKFVYTAEQLRRGGSLSYRYLIEGQVMGSATAEVPANARCDRIRFLQGDACNLPKAEELGGPFHIVHAANLLCRLPNPRLFLDRLPSLVAADGIVAFFSPYSWLQQYTDQKYWLGGKSATGGSAGSAPVSSVAEFASSTLSSRFNLIAVMRELGFELLSESNAPFLIREHARKFQWGCSNVLVFGKQRAPSSAGAVV